MTAVLYGCILFFSILCSAIYIFIWHKHFNVNISMIFAFIPITCLGHYMYSSSRSMGEILTAQKLIYLGGSFLQLFMLFAITDLCQLAVRRWIRTALLLVCTAAYSGTLTIGYTDHFYSRISFSVTEGNAVLTRAYGWMHTAYFAVVLAFFLLGLAVIVYSVWKKKDVPRRIVVLITVPYLIVLVSYFVGRRLYSHMDLMPAGYLMAQVTYLIISARMNLYDVADTAIDSMVHERALAYLSFDFKYRYLGSNESAKQLMPELVSLRIDEVIGDSPAERELRRYLDSFRENPEHNAFTYVLSGKEGEEDGARIYKVSVNYLYDGSRRRGYIITFFDDTANHRYIQLLDSYNEKLRSEVEEKTSHILKMHDNLIMSLAMMVESRDNSTGGHIKRTSEGVRILIEEIRKEGRLDLSEAFCRDVIKAAPMHDLGKIAVDDVVLRKPGRFTPEEYEMMKHHAAEGARVIHEILLQTDDEAFREVAENVAHYHHERWDGSGYPEQLSGDEIPLEARIMAVADVYDALVSKRVYKEAYDFDKANRIILEGMGTQFDPGLKTAYVNARSRLEAYYAGLA